MHVNLSSKAKEVLREAEVCAHRRGDPFIRLCDIRRALEHPDFAKMKQPLEERDPADYYRRALPFG